MTEQNPTRKPGKRAEWQGIALDGLPVGAYAEINGTRHVNGEFVAVLAQVIRKTAEDTWRDDHNDFTYTDIRARNQLARSRDGLRLFDGTSPDPLVSIPWG